jgi:hypothetical protein
MAMNMHMANVAEKNHQNVAMKKAAVVCPVAAKENVAAN